MLPALSSGHVRRRRASTIRGRRREPAAAPSTRRPTLPRVPLPNPRNACMNSTTAAAIHAGLARPRWSWLPAEGSWRYHLLLLSLGVLVLGPLGGVTASYMNFSLGFFVGGQVLAGPVGSAGDYRQRVAGQD